MLLLLLLWIVIYAAIRIIIILFCVVCYLLTLLLMRKLPNSLFLNFSLCSSSSLSFSQPPSYHVNPILPCPLDDCLHCPLLDHVALNLLSPRVETVCFELLSFIGYHLICCLFDLLLDELIHKIIESIVQIFSLLNSYRICQFVG